MQDPEDPGAVLVLRLFGLVFETMAKYNQKTDDILLPVFPKLISRTQELAAAASNPSGGSCFCCTSRDCDCLSTSRSSCNCAILAKSTRCCHPGVNASTHASQTSNTCCCGAGFLRLQLTLFRSISSGKFLDIYSAFASGPLLTDTIAFLTAMLHAPPTTADKVLQPLVDISDAGNNTTLMHCGPDCRPVRCTTIIMYCSSRAYNRFLSHANTSEHCFSPEQEALLESFLIMPAQLAHLLAFVSRIMPPLVSSLQVISVSCSLTCTCSSSMWLTVSHCFDCHCLLIICPAAGPADPASQQNPTAQYNCKRVHGKEPLVIAYALTQTLIPSSISISLRHSGLVLLQSRPELVQLALRTLEYWVDTLNPEYLEPAMADVMPRLMHALWAHLRPPPYPFGPKVRPHLLHACSLCQESSPAPCISITMLDPWLVRLFVAVAAHR